ncbi:MAG: CpsD/CapB family tyrosine-protein kinase [Clostridia bacterium]|nr:CpsD/CapB family tyrosine-protein kinase [Clostridia bacterium]
MKKIVLKEDVKKNYFVTEAYRTLRTNVQFCGKDVKVVALTSCMPNEGKTTIAIELGKSLSEVGKKVLLIDADLRKSVVVRKYTSESGVMGLSQFLSGQVAKEDVLYQTQYEGLDVIFAGQYPPNPVELLSGKSFKEFLEESKEVYDYILIDTPPLGMVIDSAVVAGLCDSAIMVISAGRIRRAKALEVKAQLQRSGVRILGVVLNHAETKRDLVAAKRYYREKKYYKTYYRHESGSKDSSK